MEKMHFLLYRLCVATKIHSFRSCGIGNIIFHSLHDEQLQLILLFVTSWIVDSRIESIAIRRIRCCNVALLK